MTELSTDPVTCAHLQVPYEDVGLEKMLCPARQGVDIDRASLTLHGGVGVPLNCMGAIRVADWVAGGVGIAVNPQILACPKGEGGCGGLRGGPARASPQPANSTSKTPIHNPAPTDARDALRHVSQDHGWNTACHGPSLAP